MVAGRWQAAAAQKGGRHTGEVHGLLGKEYVYGDLGDWDKRRETSTARTTGSAVPSARPGADD